MSMYMKLGLDARNRVRTARRDGWMPGASLRLRRSWYTDEGQGTDDTSSGNQGAADIGDPTKSLEAFLALLPDNLKEAGKSLVTKLRETGKEAGDYRIAAKRAEEAKSTAEAAALAEQGKYKELYEKTQRELDALKPAQERATALEAKIQATNEGRVKRIPEAMRSVIPSDYTPDKLSEWLDANEHLLTKVPAPNLNGGTGGSGGAGATQQPKVTPEQSTIAGIAQRLGYNVKPEQVAARAKEIEEQRQRKPTPDKE